MNEFRKNQKKKISQIIITLKLCNTLSLILEQQSLIDLLTHEKHVRKWQRGKENYCRITWVKLMPLFFQTQKVGLYSFSNFRSKTKLCLTLENNLDQNNKLPNKNQKAVQNSSHLHEIQIKKLLHRFKIFKTKGF